MHLFIFEVVLLPIFLLSLNRLHRYGLLNANVFGVGVAAYLSILTSTLAYYFPPMSVGRDIDLVLSVLCWFPGYRIMKRLYTRIFPHE